MDNQTMLCVLVISILGWTIMINDNLKPCIKWKISSLFEPVDLIYCISHGYGL